MALAYTFADGETLTAGKLNAYAVNGEPETSAVLTPVAGTFTATPTAYQHDGWVDLVGSFTVAAGTSPVTPAIPLNTATTLCVLPVGFRPDRQTEGTATPFGSVTQITCGVRISTAGVVEVFVNNAGSGTTTARFSLNGIRFRRA